MTNFKSLVMGALLVAPLMAGATTTSFSSVGTSTGNGAQINGVGSLLSSGSYTGAGYTLVNMGLELVFTDKWTLTVPTGETANITFADLKPGNNKITAFLVTETKSNFLTPDFTLPVTASVLSSYSYAVANPGTYYFLVGGSSTNPDQYKVSTTVAAVPVPAAAWLMGSALLGAVSLRKRKAA